MKVFLPIIALGIALQLSAAESVQILSDPAAETTAGWKAFGRNATKADGNILVFQKKPSEKTERCIWRGNTVVPKKAVSGPFILTFEAETSSITPERAGDPWGGAVALVHGHKDGKYVNIKAQRFDDPAAGFRKCTVKGTIPENMTDLYVEFSLQNASGDVRVKNISMVTEGAGNKITGDGK